MKLKVASLCCNWRNVRAVNISGVVQKLQQGGYTDLHKEHSDLKSFFPFFRNENVLLKL